MNVLITSLSAKVSCAKRVTDALNRVTEGGQVWGGDVDPDCLARHFVDKFWHMPSLNDLSADALVEFCKSNGIKVIIPTRDGELAFFAERRNALKEAGIHVMVSGAQTIETCVDKLKFSERLIEKGYPAIPSYPTPEACPTDALVIKKRFGAGAADIKINVPKSEVADYDADTIFQPYIEGQELSIDTFTADECLPEGAIVRRRDKVVRGESQITTAVDEPELEELCIKASKEIGIYGHAVWQAFKDADGRYHIIECNSRIGGASSLSLAMGLDSFYWFFTKANGRDTSGLAFNRNPENLQQIRAPYDTFKSAHTGL